MQQHLSAQRHLNYATLLLAVYFVGSPAKFAAAFKGRLFQAQLIVLSITTSRDFETGLEKHKCVVICAGKTEQQMVTVMNEVYAYCANSTTV